MPLERVDPKGQGQERGFVPAIKAGGTIYVSGQVGRGPDGNLAGPDITSQTRQVFENLKSVLALAGAGFEHMTKITVFLTKEEYMGGFRAVRSEYFKGGSYPTSTLVIISALAQPDILVEVEAIAYVG